MICPRTRAACLAVAALAGAVASAAARADCSHDWVCVDPEERDGEHVLVARNLKPWPATLTVSVGSGSAWRGRRDEVTVTLAGGERRVLDKLGSGARAPAFAWDWTPGSLRVGHDADYAYRLPYAGHVGYRVLQSFGSRFSHTGRERYAVDFDMPVGTPVHAARDGVVVMTHDTGDRACWDRGCGRHANYIVVLHDDGTTGEYYHLDQGGVVVKEGQRVVRGQHIGYSGHTGRSTTPHLHFAVYRAVAWGRTQSLRFRFSTDDGPVERLQPGVRYRPGAD